MSLIDHMRMINSLSDAQLNELVGALDGQGGQDDPQHPPKKKAAVVPNMVDGHSLADDLSEARAFQAHRPKKYVGGMEVDVPGDGPDFGDSDNPLKQALTTRQQGAPKAPAPSRSHGVMTMHAPPDGGRVVEPLPPQQPKPNPDDHPGDIDLRDPPSTSHGVMTMHAPPAGAPVVEPLGARPPQQSSGKDPLRDFLFGGQEQQPTGKELGAPPGRVDPNLSRALSQQPADAVAAEADLKARRPPPSTSFLEALGRGTAAGGTAGLSRLPMSYGHGTGFKEGFEREFERDSASHADHPLGWGIGKGIGSTVLGRNVMAATNAIPGMASVSSAASKSPIAGGFAGRVPGALGPGAVLSMGDAITESHTPSEIPGQMFRHLLDIPATTTAFALAPAGENVGARGRIGTGMRHGAIIGTVHAATNPPMGMSPTEDPVEYFKNWGREALENAVVGGGFSSMIEAPMIASRHLGINAPNRWEASRQIRRGILAAGDTPNAAARRGEFDLAVGGEKPEETMFDRVNNDAMSGLVGDAAAKDDALKGALRNLMSSRRQGTRDRVLADTRDAAVVGDNQNQSTTANPQAPRGGDRRAGGLTKGAYNILSRVLRIDNREGPRRTQDLPEAQATGTVPLDPFTSDETAAAIAHRDNVANQQFPEARNAHPRAVKDPELVRLMQTPEMQKILDRMAGTIGGRSAPVDGDGNLILSPAIIEAAYRALQSDYRSGGPSITPLERFQLRETLDGVRERLGREVPQWDAAMKTYSGNSRYIDAIELGMNALKTIRGDKHVDDAVQQGQNPDKYSLVTHGIEGIERAVANMKDEHEKTLFRRGLLTAILNEGQTVGSKGSGTLRGTQGIVNRWIFSDEPIAYRTRALLTGGEPGERTNPTTMGYEGETPDGARYNNRLEREGRMATGASPLRGINKEEGDKEHKTFFDVLQRLVDSEYFTKAEAQEIYRRVAMQGTRATIQTLRELEREAVQADQRAGLRSTFQNVLTLNNRHGVPSAFGVNEPLGPKDKVPK